MKEMTILLEMIVDTKSNMTEEKVLNVTKYTEDFNKKYNMKQENPFAIQAKEIELAHISGLPWETIKNAMVEKFPNMLPKYQAKQ